MLSLNLLLIMTVADNNICSAINKAWKEAYVGEEHKLLFDNIARMVWKGPYGNTASIIQSSGTGKSRLVYEYAALVFTISFNLRAEIENKCLSCFHFHREWMSKYLALTPFLFH